MNSLVLDKAKHVGQRQIKDSFGLFKTNEQAISAQDAGSERRLEKTGIKTSVIIFPLTKYY
jgi:hypothetical protein